MQKIMEHQPGICPHFPSTTTTLWNGQFNVRMVAFAAPTPSYPPAPARRWRNEYFAPSATNRKTECRAGIHPWLSDFQHSETTSTFRKATSRQPWFVPFNIHKTFAAVVAVNTPLCGTTPLVAGNTGTLEQAGGGFTGAVWARDNRTTIFVRGSGVFPCSLLPWRHGFPSTGGIFLGAPARLTSRWPAAMLRANLWRGWGRRAGA